MKVIFSSLLLTLFTLLGFAQSATIPYRTDFGIEMDRTPWIFYQKLYQIDWYNCMEAEDCINDGNNMIGYILWTTDGTSWTGFKKELLVNVKDIRNIILSFDKRLQWDDICDYGSLYLTVDNSTTEYKLHDFYEANANENWVNVNLNISEAINQINPNAEFIKLIFKPVDNYPGKERVMWINNLSLISVCYSNLVLTSLNDINVYSNNNAILSSNTIEASSITLESNSNLVFAASESVKLKTGFKAVVNSNFIANLQGCDFQTTELKSSKVIKKPIDPILIHNATVYPNPTTGKFSVSNGPADAVLGNIKVFNSSGKLIINQKSNSNSEVIDLSGYPDGIYFLIAESGSQTVTQKIIKE